MIPPTNTYHEKEWIMDNDILHPFPIDYMEYGPCSLTASEEWIMVTLFK